MRDELTKKLIDYLGNFEDFATSELPSFANEILNYKFYYTIFELIFLFILPLFFILLLLASSNFLEEYYLEGFVMIFGIPIFLFIAISVFFDINVLIQICYAPKLYLLEYAAHLLK